ncbi:hypothetical protein BJV77DRAFT_1028971 [Russula vinacea]|nr:hypothetical protein BJV77DRAFT_1028971 [Russula vinacea]
MCAPTARPLQRLGTFRKLRTVVRRISGESGCSGTGSQRSPVTARFHQDSQCARATGSNKACPQRTSTLQCMAY